MLPSASVSTRPYAVGLSTGVSTIVARARRSRCRRMTPAEVDLGEHVAVEHDDRFGQLVARVLDGPGRAERRRLDDVANLDAERRSRRRRSPRCGAAGN